MTAAAKTSLVRGLGAVAIIVVIWTSFLLLSRHGAKGSLSAWDLAALRFTVSGLVMLPFLMRAGLAGLSLKRATILTLSAGPGFAIFAYWGFSFAPAAHGAVLMPGVLPVFTTLLSIWILKERITPLRWLALALVASGVAAIGWTSLMPENATYLVGDGLFLCACASWSIYTVMARRWQLAPIQAVTIVAPLAMLAFMPFYLTVLPRTVFDAPLLEIVVQGLFQGIGAVIIVLLAFTAAIRHLGPQLTTLMTAIVPALASVLAVPLLDEPLTTATVLGLALVSCGMVATVVAAGR